MKQIKTIAANSGTTLFCWIVFEGLYFVLFGLSSAVEWFAASDNKFVYVLGTAVCILPVFLLYLLFYPLGRKYLNYTNSFWSDFIPILVAFALAQLLLTALTVDFFPFPPMEMLLCARFAEPVTSEADLLTNAEIYCLGLSFALPPVLLFALGLQKQRTEDRDVM